MKQQKTEEKTKECLNCGNEVTKPLPFQWFCSKQCFWKYTEYENA